MPGEASAGGLAAVIAAAEFRGEEHPGEEFPVVAVAECQARFAGNKITGLFTD